MRRLFALIFVVVFSQSTAYAQLISAQIGVDGLTCSACSKAVEMSIRKLNFVDSISMNLEHTEGKIIFKKNVKVEVDKIAKAVIDAGFSLRSLYCSVNMGPLQITNDLCWVADDNNYHFVKISENTKSTNIISLRFIGEKFMSRKEYKNWKIYCDTPCNISSSKNASFSKNYYVTLL